MQEHLEQSLINLEPCAENGSELTKQIVEDAMNSYTDQTKHCTKCDERHNITKFYHNKNTKDGLQPYCKSAQFKMNKRYVTKMRNQHNKDEQYAKRNETNKKEYSDIVKENTRLYVDPLELGDFTVTENGKFKKIKLVIPTNFEISTISAPKIEKSKILNENGSTTKREQYTTITLLIKQIK